MESGTTDNREKTGTADPAAATPLAPAESGLAIAIAQYHLTRRRPEAALAALAEALRQAEDALPKDRVALAETLAAIASSLAQRKQHEPAAGALAQARALADGPRVWRAEAALASAQADAGAAMEAWRRVTHAEPEDAAAWLALARASESAGEAASAAEAYLRAARLDRSHATVLAVAERLRALAPAQAEPAGPTRVRIALIGSSTLDHLCSHLEVACRLAGLTPTFYLGPFGQYAQDILDPASALYAFAPEVVIVAIHGRAFFPDLYDHPLRLDPDARREGARQVVERAAGLLGQLTARTGALVLFHTFATPQYSPLGTLDRRDSFGQSALFAAINEGLAERVRQDFPTVRLVDEDRVYGRIGKREVTDPRLWFMARIGIGEGAAGALADEYLRSIKALKGRTRKCLVLDLDNTLWGGVVGEDGPHGIALGDEAPGNAYRAFQAAILDLWERGIILAVNSKNNPADALEVLEHHPDMLLRPSHFAALRINWQDKATNLREIAQELNLGLESFVFMDDNPAECARVRAQLPEVLTVQLPRDPARYRATLLALTDFDSLALTEEDRQRGKLYAQRRERQDWEARHGDDLGAYLDELGLEVELARADDFAIPRIAQLIGKTNQFNLTTRRHNEAAVRAFAASGSARVYGARVRDRFGEHGLVGVAIVAAEGETWEVDTLLLSCRVLGCGVETALLSALVAEAREAGARRLRGVFIPTAKNTPARDLYRDHGFELVEERDGAECWELDLATGAIEVPRWLTLHTPELAPAQR